MTTKPHSPKSGVFVDRFRFSGTRSSKSAFCGKDTVCSSRNRARHRTLFQVNPTAVREARFVNLRELSRLPTATGPTTLLEGWCVFCVTMKRFEFLAKNHQSLSSTYRLSVMPWEVTQNFYEKDRADWPPSKLEYLFQKSTRAHL